MVHETLTTLDPPTVLARARAFFPRPEFCTDDAAMIALAGHHRLVAGEREGLEVRARARWPLDELRPPGTAPFN